MIIREACWLIIRDGFTEEEKAALRACITGEAICPRGVIIDETRLTEKLRAKLIRNMEAWRKAAKR